MEPLDAVLWSPLGGCKHLLHPLHPLTEVRRNRSPVTATHDYPGFSTAENLCKIRGIKIMPRINSILAGGAPGSRGEEEEFRGLNSSLGEVAEGRDGWGLVFGRNKEFRIGGKVRCGREGGQRTEVETPPGVMGGWEV